MSMLQVQQFTILALRTQQTALVGLHLGTSIGLAELEIGQMGLIGQ